MKENQFLTPLALNEHLPSVSNALAVDNRAEFPLREYIRIVLKYRTLIIAGGIAGAVFGLIYGFTATPQYTATSKVRISTYQPVLAATKIEDMLQEKSKEANYLETQLEEMKSFSLADRVLQDPEVHEAVGKRVRGSLIERLLNLGSDGDHDAENKVTESEYHTPVGSIKEYLGAINVRPIRRTALVIIEATWSDPKTAALIANKHGEAYRDWVRAYRVEQQARGLKFLRTQSDELREKVADLEGEMADYAEANSIIAINKDENITAQKMSQLNNLLTASTGKRIEAEKAYQEADASLNTPSAGFDDPTTQSLRSDLGRLEGEYGQLSAKFTESYPRVRQLRAQIDQVKATIQNQRRQVVLGLKAKATAALEEERNLKEELEKQKSQAFELTKRQVQYNILSRDLTSSRELLENVMRQIKETSLAVESNSSNVSIVDYAVTPRSPSFPRKKVLFGVGLIAGFGLGVLIAIALNYLDNTVRTPEDLTELVGIPSLGVVPSFVLSDDESEALPEGALKKTTATGSALIRLEKGIAPAVVYLKEPQSLAAEAYRTIRTGILLSQAGEPPRTILVSSAQSSEGKTTSSINLAASLASAGGRVVLIDADLRRPSVGKYFGLAMNLPGLVDVITGQARVEEVTLHDLIKRVSVIPSGQIPPNPAELLGSLEMASLLDTLAEEYDYVLIDSPPVLPVTDSVILSRYVDGVVMVVRGAATPRKIVKDAMERLRAVGARMLGAVLNDIDITSGDYYYYNRYYQSYYLPREEHKPRVSGSQA